MKAHTTLCLALLCSSLSAADESKKESPAPTAPETTAAEKETAGREAKFKKALTNATLAGRWCSVEKGTLGPDKEEKYVINSVTKMTGDLWLITAQIQYGTKNFTAPVPVSVKWAGDTPVIVVDNVGFPGGNKYSARVMFFDGTYSGSWSGGNHGGLLHGVLKYEEKP